MVVKYEYSPIPVIPDLAYFRDVIIREIPVRLIGIVTQIFRDTLVIQFETALTPEQKDTLDSLIASPPSPVSEYELCFLTPEDIEAEIGVRPVSLEIDPTTRLARCKFDTTLTPTQETMLEALLRSPIKFKRRKP